MPRPDKESPDIIDFCSFAGFFNPVFLMKKYLEDPAAVRRGYLHMLLHCLYLHIFMEPDRDSGEWDRECDCFVEQLFDKAVGEGKISLKKRKSYLLR